MSHENQSVTDRVGQYIPSLAPQPFDYRAIVNARGDLKRRAQMLRAAAVERRYRPVAQAMRLGMAAQACDAAAQALFEALNTTAHYGEDPEALRVVHMERFLTVAEQAAEEAEEALERR